MTSYATSANGAWLRLLADLLAHGGAAHPNNPAGATVEMLGYQTVVDMLTCAVTVPQRKLGYRFLAAESAWILSGDNRLSSIQPFSKRISDTSDDQLTFRGAYGPKFVDQVGWVAEELLRDPATRRAVLNIWRERPGPTRDVPCTVALQWLVRDYRLNCVVTMRSSDAWLGWPYDVHTFAMMTLHLLLVLRQQGPRFHSVRPGSLILTAGSQHLYERDVPNARACVEAISTIHLLRPLDDAEFGHPDALTAHLWRVARKEPTDKLWLTDLVRSA